MLRFLRRKKPTSSAGSDVLVPLYFKSGDAALEMACKYMDCSLTEGSFLPAVVLDSRKLFGTEDSVKMQANGTQLAMLRVASSDGGFLVAANTAYPNGPSLEPGQLVLWQAMSFIPEMSKVGTSDERLGWAGLIFGTLKPEYVNGSWVADEQYLP